MYFPLSEIEYRYVCRPVGRCRADKALVFLHNLKSKDAKSGNGVLVCVEMHSAEHVFVFLSSKWHVFPKMWHISVRIFSCVGNLGRRKEIDHLYHLFASWVKTGV